MILRLRTVFDMSGLRLRSSSRSGKFSRIFSDFKSLCTMRIECKYFKPLRICNAMLRTMPSLKFSVICLTFARSPPLQYSKIRK